MKTNKLLCVPNNNNSLWNDPNTWSGSIIPSVQDFVILNNCNILIERISNITINGIKIQNAKLHIDGNLKAIQYIHNSGTINLKNNGILTSSLYFENKGYINAKQNSNLYINGTFVNELGTIRLSSSKVELYLINSSVNIGYIILYNSTIPTLLLSNNNSNGNPDILDIYGESFVNTLNVTNGHIYINSESILYTDNITMISNNKYSSNSNLYLTLTSLLKVRSANINTKLSIDIPRDYNYSGTVTNIFIKANESINYNFTNVKKHILQQIKYDSNGKYIISINNKKLDVYYTLKYITDETVSYVMLVLQIIISISIMVSLVLNILTCIKNKKILKDDVLDINTDVLDINTDVVDINTDDIEKNTLFCINFSIIAFIFYLLLLFIVSVVITSIPNSAECGRCVFTDSTFGLYMTKTFPYIILELIILSISIFIISKYRKFSLCVISISVGGITIFIILTLLGFIYIFEYGMLTCTPNCETYKIVFLTLGSFMLVPLGLFVLAKICGASL